jgi:hypothetical protein
MEYGFILIPMSSQQVSGPCDSDVAGVFDTDGEFCSS